MNKLNSASSVANLKHRRGKIAAACGLAMTFSNRSLDCALRAALGMTQKVFLCALVSLWRNFRQDYRIDKP